MALGQAIAAQPVAEAGLRRLATEQIGPRPAGTRAEETTSAPAERRTSGASRP